MSKMRLVSLLLAAGCAIGAALLAQGLVGKRTTETTTVVESTVKKTEALVAAKDIGMGEKLAQGLVIWREWPEETLAPNMITKLTNPNALEEYAETRARVAMFEGEPILDKKVVKPGQGGFMAAILPKGMRAISVAVSERSSAGGFILPNDRVDVILTRKIPGSDSQTLVQSETVLSNVRVMAINQTYQQEQEEGKISVAEGKTATIEITPRQAEIIALVESQGELSLALRSIAENDGKKLEDILPETAEKFSGTAKAGNSSDTLFVRYGIETYAQNR
jgi:pilus assembly protein CpaB